MKLIDLITSPWAITRAGLEEICAIYSTHLRGEKIDLKAVEAALGRPLANEQRSYEVVDGIAVLPLEGVMAPKANLFMQLCGGVSMQLAQRELAAAVADPAVRAIVLQIDSPGGTVIGTPELAAAVAAARQTKRLVTWSDGTLASAAYWVGSAADAVYISGAGNVVGSIGVVTAHRDVSEANRQAGVKVTEISAGRYKRIASSHEPLSSDGRASLQADVDYLYSVFVDAVAAHRGTSVDDVLERMADGRTFIGRQAIDAGLVDGVTTLSELIAELSSGARITRGRASAQLSGAGVAPTAPTSAGAALPETPATQGAPMPPADPTPITREAFERDHAALFAQLRADFRAEGATAERDRIAAVRAESLAGHEALIERLAFDGKTTGAEAAQQVLAAERTLRNKAASDHAADAPDAAPGAHAPADKPAAGAREEQADKAEAYAREHKVDFVTAMKTLGFAE